MNGRASGVLLLLAASAARAQQQPDVALLRCGEGSAAACVSSRADLDPAVTRRLIGQESDSLARSWRGRFLADTALVAVGRPAVADDRPSRVLVVLDVSGSMKGPKESPKIGTAKAVLKGFIRSLSQLSSPAIRVAVAPFGSVDVAARIAAARFTTPDSAELVVNGLPAPDRENTALYSAAVLGAEKLTAEVKRAGPGTSGLLIIITDGRNDIGPGDDAGLLDDANGGAAQAARILDDSPIAVGVIAIGVGPEDLHGLAGRRGIVFPVSGDPKAYELSARLGQIARVLRSSWDVTVPLAGGRAQLARGLATLQLDLGIGKERLAGGMALWRPPIVALPAFAGIAPAGVVSAAAVRLESRWTWLGPVLFALFLGLLLVEIWIVLPRFLWPPVAVAPATPAADRAPAKAARGSLRTDLEEVAPRKPSDVTASKARRA